MEISEENCQSFGNGRKVMKLLIINSLKQRPGEKKKIIKNNAIYNTCHGLLSQEWIDGRYFDSGLY